MRKSSFISLFTLVSMLFTGCGVKAPPAEPGPEEGGAITFINDMTEADVWILPQTEKNLKTTVWGTATVGKLGAGEERSLSLETLGGPGIYILRIIDADGAYYAVNDLALEAGAVLQFKSDGSFTEAVILWTDGDGTAHDPQRVFVGMLGGK